MSHTVLVSGQQSVSLYFYGIELATAKRRDGTAASAIAYNTANMAIVYTRERSAPVVALVGSGTPPVTLAATTTAWTSLGFIHCGDGLYRVDFPDAAFAASGSPRYVVCDVIDRGGVTGFIPANFVDLSATDPRSATIPTVNATQLAGQTITASGGVTFPAATLASTTNITSASGVALSAAGVQAIWDALTSALTTVGSIGKLIVDNLNATISSRAIAGDAMTLTSGERTATGTAVWATTTRALTDKVGFALSSAGVQAIWDALTSALTTVGSIGKLLVDNINATISSRSTYAGGAVASVTGNVGGNVVGSVGSVTGAVGSVTGLTASDVGAIKTVTDHLATGLELDGAVYRFTTNALEQAPSGTGASAASIRAEIDANSTQLALLVTGVDALPTNAELATALAAADDAVLNAIAALNNLSSAGAQAAAAAALTAYGAATGTSVSGVPAAVLAAAATTPIAADAKKMNGATIQGNGTSGNLWRG